MLYIFDGGKFFRDCVVISMFSFYVNLVAHVNNESTLHSDRRYNTLMVGMCFQHSHLSVVLNLSSVGLVRSLGENRRAIRHLPQVC